MSTATAISELRTVDLPSTLYIHGVTEEMFGELVDEDTRAELLDGVMIVHSPASRRHDLLSKFLGGLMDFYVDTKDLGQVLGPDSVVHLATCRKLCPDVYFIRKSRVPDIEQEEFEGAPDLVLETLSPSNRNVDLRDKRPAYREAGVREIWFIDPAKKQLLIDRKRGQGYREQVVSSGKVSSDVLKGFWIKADWLWANPLPKKPECLKQILGTS
jgi:Uma2 family endonuclease